MYVPERDGELLASGGAETGGGRAGLLIPLYVVAYLAAIVAANVSISHWGPVAAVYNGFLFIGLDLTTRDRLHDAWRGHLRRNMAALIVAGAVLSYLATWLVPHIIGEGFPSAGRVAVASGVAFGLASLADALVYHVRRKASWSDRSNESNVAGSFVDSLLFFPLAGFGWPIATMFALFCAKIAGGYVWSVILRGGRALRAARA